LAPELFSRYANPGFPLGRNEATQDDSSVTGRTRDVSRAQPDIQLLQRSKSRAEIQRAFFGGWRSSG
jgi:hypothetical protein